MKPSNNQNESPRIEIPEKKLLVCLRCGHEYKSKAQKPHCSKCGSFKSIDIKKAGKKEIQILHRQVKKLQEENAKMRAAMDEDFKSVGNDMKSLYRYVEQIANILKENGLVPEN